MFSCGLCTYCLVRESLYQPSGHRLIRLFPWLYSWAQVRHFWKEGTTLTERSLGGHTSEALTLLSALDFTRYYPRSYVYSQGDILSAKKAADLELVKTAELSTHPVRKVLSNRTAGNHFNCFVYRPSGPWFESESSIFSRVYPTSTLGASTPHNDSCDSCSFASCFPLLSRSCSRFLWQAVC